MTKLIETNFFESNVIGAGLEDYREVWVAKAEANVGVTPAKLSRDMFWHIFDMGLTQLLGDSASAVPSNAPLGDWADGRVKDAPTRRGYIGAKADWIARGIVERTGGKGRKSATDKWTRDALLNYCVAIKYGKLGELRTMLSKVGGAETLIMAIARLKVAAKLGVPETRLSGDHDTLVDQVCDKLMDKIESDAMKLKSAAATDDIEFDLPTN